MTKKNLIIIITILILTGNAIAETPDNYNFVIVGVQTGIKDIHGYYKNQLDESYFFEVYSFFPLPFLYNNFINRYFLGDVNLTYSTYTLSESKSSDLIASSFKAGPVLFFPAFKYFQPFLGINAGFEYLYLTTSVTGISERTYKPSFTAKAGFMVPFKSNFMIRAASEYKMFELSGEIFQEIIYGVSLAYNFKFYDEKEITSIRNAIEYDSLYDKGIEYYKKGDGQRAKINFQKISEDDKSFRDVNNYLEIIKNNEDKYNTALKLIKEKKLSEAMPILIETEKYFIEAKESLAEIRKFLMKEIKGLEEKAVKAYDGKEYIECINILNKLQMIDPENETYKLYYSKAIKRYKAIKLLE